VSIEETETPAVPGAKVPALGEELLSVKGLVKHFPIRKGVLQRQTGAVQAVDGLTFGVTRGATSATSARARCARCGATCR
jgi:peptide/nickel transport system ATP-binding protein/oligopeptide transport system ATP-binding protein